LHDIQIFIIESTPIANFEFKTVLDETIQLMMYQRI